MKGCPKNNVRRVVLGGLLTMVVLVLAFAGRTVLFKNNLPAALTQAVPLAPPDAGRLQPLPSFASGAAFSMSLTPSQAAAQTSAKTAIRAEAAVKNGAAVSKVPAKPPLPAQTKQKIVYLTFDDGPSKITPKVLEILRRQGVKATFFVLGEQAEQRPELISAIWEQGHAIGNHTYNHNYRDLYSSFTEFWSQIKQTEEIVRNITGVRPQLVRAPGGTFGHFDKTYFRLLAQAGYSVMDWTADSGDSRRKGVPAADILRESVADLTASRVILLLHDGGGHEQSAKALPEIIKRYKAAGYTFGVLDGEVQPVQFRVSASAAGAGHAQPSKAWIAANILPNLELFTPGKALALEVGLLEAKLLPGEYTISGGQYKVPLRAAVERLGGKVSWEVSSRSGRVVWNGRTILADAAHQQLTVTDGDGRQQIRSADVQLIGSSLWVSLRGLLDAAGHPPLTAAVTAEERRVKTL
ncbi:polysaccharide deacetylase family protein [Paenibacillus sonchi]|uniref:Polysaccharide deacetylase family protein n=1 Tax=Paenibacillus sonchi TaxID=373687 RepID=A0A974SEQ3_9BACL|nr:polysaccharide deacetylase [Paenibacillus sonchi]QQZ63177.1 polysaccharide deacetylase family protein [Paenibacillus sonchi]